jgi:hypothetical protein
MMSSQKRLNKVAIVLVCWCDTNDYVGPLSGMWVVSHYSAVCGSSLNSISCATNENLILIYSKIEYIYSSTSVHVGCYSVATLVSLSHLYLYVRHYILCTELN